MIRPFAMAKNDFVYIGEEPSSNTICVFSFCIDSNREVLNMKRQYQSLLGIFILCLFLLGGCAQSSERLPGDTFDREPAGSTVESGSTEGITVEDSSTVITPAPQIEFEGIDLDGNTVTSEIFAESKLTMVNVWATYCNPCLREMPGLGELAAEYDPEEFRIIGIISDVLEGDDQSLAQDLVEQTGAAYPHLLLNRSIYTALLTDVNAVPTTFFINQDGEILDTLVGSMPKSAWEEMIDALLES